MSDTWKFVGVAIAIFAAGIIAILIFSALWFRIGLGAAIVVLVGGLLLFAWRTDRKDKEARAELESM